MRAFCLGALLWSAAAAVGAGQTVESISLTGAQNYRLSPKIVQEMQRLIGQEFSQQALDDLAREVGNELGDYSVSQKVTPGDKPEHVKVVLELSAREGGAPDANINSRYTIEDVEIRGAEKDKLSHGLVRDIQKLVGEKFSHETADDLAWRIRRELRAHSVSPVVTRGDKPDHVKVAFEVSLQARDEADVNLSKFLYHSKQGWSAKAIGRFEIADNNNLLFGLVSDGDDLLERYAGITAGFESKKLATDRLRLRFLFETYHHQWNRATLLALDEAPDVPGIYRTRQSFQPTLTVIPVTHVSLSVGTSFQLFQTQFPTARTEAANAAVAEARYRQSFRDTAENRHDVEAGYSLRAATRTFESDYVYSRHLANFGYAISGRKQGVSVNVMGGAITGRPPLFERYVLGNSTTLRGWHKFDAAPLGGTRVVHNSLEYHHNFDDGGRPSLVVSYDTGAVWDRSQPAKAKHAIGLAVRWAFSFFTGLAFPIKRGRAEPIFMVGTNF